MIFFTMLFWCFLLWYKYTCIFIILFVSRTKIYQYIYPWFFILILCSMINILLYQFCNKNKEIYSFWIFIPNMHLRHYFVIHYLNSYIFFPPISFPWYLLWFMCANHKFSCFKNHWMRYGYCTSNIRCLVGTSDTKRFINSIWDYGRIYVIYILLHNCQRRELLVHSVS